MEEQFNKYENNDYKPKTNDFRQFINEYIRCRKSYDSLEEDTRRKVRMNELVERMGIPYETLKKVLNRTRPTKSRDYIIAICSQLRLSYDATNEALFLYNMPILQCDTPSLQSDSKDEVDSNNNLGNYHQNSYQLRDDLLITLIYECEKYGYSIEYINSQLRIDGFEELDIPDRNTKKNVIDKNKYIPLFDVFGPIVKTNFDDQLLFSSSLDHLYDIDEYECSSSLKIIKKDNSNESYILSAGLDEDCAVIDLRKKSSRPIYKYNQNTDNILFKDYFRMLIRRNNKEMKKIFTQLNDTKNYRQRVNARFDNGEIIVFGEGFNYYLPELNEYLFVKFTSGEWKYEITNQSQFLLNKYGKSKYIKYLNKYNLHSILKPNQYLLNEEYPLKGKRKIFSTLEEIDDYYSYQLEESLSRYISKHVKQTFIEIKSEIEKLIEQLKNNEVYFRDSYYLISDEQNKDYYFCYHFDLLESFEFYKQELKASSPEGDEFYDDIYVPGKKEVLFKYKGQDCLVSLDDVKEAFEYGLNSLEDILFVKNKYGSIKKMIDVL